MTKVRKFLLGIIVVCLLLLIGLVGMVLKEMDKLPSMPKIGTVLGFVTKHEREKAAYQAFVDLMLPRIQKIWPYEQNLVNAEKAAGEQQEKMQIGEGNLDETMRLFHEWRNKAETAKEFNQDLFTLSHEESLSCAKAGLTLSKLYSDTLLDSVVNRYNSALTKFKFWSENVINVVDNLDRLGYLLNNPTIYETSVIQSCKDDIDRALPERKAWQEDFFKDYLYVIEDCAWLIAKYDLHYTQDPQTGPTVQQVEEQRGKPYPYHHLKGD